MMFWFKKKKIVVDCLTNIDSVHELYKIRKAAVYYPEDIKSLTPNTRVKHPQTNIEYDISTIKKCNGINEMYKRGFIMPMWTDFICQPKSAAAGNSAIGMMPRHFSYESHPRDQFTGLYNNYTHVKLESPWLFKEKTGVRFIWKPADWNIHKFSKNFVIPTAVLWFNDQSSTNINMFIDTNSDDFTILGGTPMIHMLPLSEDNVEIKCHLVSPEEMNSSLAIPLSYGAIKSGRYNNYVREKSLSEELDKKEKGKCPFGFGK